MTASAALKKQPEDRAEQLEQLRRRMAAVSGRVGIAWRPADNPADGPAGSAGLLPVPESLAAQLPAGLPKGAVAVHSGARSLPVSMVAAVTGAGGHAAVVGLPDFGLLAAVEMGADLSRVAVIPNPGADPVEVVSVLLDGMDLVVLGLGGCSVPAGRARAVLARARQRGCTLLVTGGRWQGASVRMDARVSGYEITACRAGAPVAGCGRISAVRLSVRAQCRGRP